MNKNYFFCDVCGKCYIYMGWFEKHKLLCLKNENLIEENIIIKSAETSMKNVFDVDEDIYNYKDCKKIDREKLMNKSLNKDELFELMCPFYLFFCTLIFGFIKGIFCGF